MGVNGNEPLIAAAPDVRFTSARSNTSTARPIPERLGPSCWDRSTLPASISIPTARSQLIPVIASTSHSIIPTPERRQCAQAMTVASRGTATPPSCPVAPIACGRWLRPDGCYGDCNEGLCESGVLAWRRSRSDLDADIYWRRGYSSLKTGPLLQIPGSSDVLRSPKFMARCRKNCRS